MPLQDLTPELRTRLRQVERTVGWFVALAAIVLLGGFAYYIYATAKSRGWFVTKLNYATSLDSAAGIHPGDVVTLMGFPAGNVTDIQPNDPDKSRGVTIFFTIRDPYWGYIWYDSKVRVNSDFLGHRSLEVVKGVNGQPSAYLDKTDGKLLVMDRLRARDAYTSILAKLKEASGNTNLPTDTILQEATNELMAIIKTNRAEYYTNAIRGGYTASVSRKEHNYYWIAPDEEPALSDRLAAVATSVQMAMPAILGLTNQLGAVLSNANVAVAELQGTLAEARPSLTNLSAITEHLRDPNGSLGNWLLPTNLTAQLNETLVSARETLQTARGTLDTTDTNLTMVATDLDKTLQHLADLTSNLAWQVSINTNLVGEISTTIIHTDDLVQGLKREWFLRGAFKKKKTETPAAK
jgi:ABC-type transporter Mla subunit MlaD